MSQTREFWQYAEEAMLGAYQAKTDEEKRAMLALAHTWSQAALISERSVLPLASDDASPC